MLVGGVCGPDKENPANVEMPNLRSAEKTFTATSSSAGSIKTSDDATVIL